MSDTDLFGEIPKQASPPKRKGLAEGMPQKLWTTQKSLLICEYLHRFLLVTKSGVYLDLFAGPQAETEGEEDWTVKRVLERRTNGPTFKHFAVCDSDTDQVRRLRELAQLHAERPFRFCVYSGDANEQIGQMLIDAPLESKMPTFCLIDQRTLECDWATVAKVASYKVSGMKVEILYFLAQGWLDRSLKSRKDDRPRLWWGRDGVESFLALQAVHRARAMCNRFTEELGYEFADAWTIYEHGTSGRIMYYLIHASDHPDARRLMSEAYAEVPRRHMKLDTQHEMFGLGDASDGHR